MENKNQIKLFNDYKIRTKWDENKEEWLFSVIDIVGVLSESKNPNRYWSDLKKKLTEESGQPYENIVRLKLKASDGKKRLTDTANTEEILRIIQSIPSPNAEPFKRWLAKIGKEHLDEIADPQLAIERAISNYREKGYSENWITQRLKTIEFRKELTAEWDRAGVKEGLEYAILTDEITKAWSGMTKKEYKQFKSVKKENLRDNMSDVELVLNMLAEVSTTQISKVENPEGFHESKKVATRGGSVANDARKSFEKQTGGFAITNRNADEPELLDIQKSAKKKK
jgi:hypothetical protein